jgi:hypothetical protein
LAVLRASPRRAIFDLAHLESLSSAQGLNLFVSPRTLYVLQNLVAADVGDWTRYAKQILEGGWYITPSEEDDEWQTMLDTIEGVEVEVYPVTSLCQFPTITIDDIDTYAIGSTATIEKVIPAGEVWQIQGLAVKNQQHSCGYHIETKNPSTGKSCWAVYNGALSAGYWVGHTCGLHLVGGMAFRATFFDCTDVDHVYLMYHAAVWEE